MNDLAAASLAPTLCREVGRFGIRVNAIAPGLIETDLLKSPRSAPYAGEWLERARGFVPLGRTGTAGEVAAVASFLLSAEASYVNGHVLVVDGGLTT